MPFCSSCGTQAPDEAAFCAKCGKKIFTPASALQNTSKATPSALLAPATHAEPTKEELTALFVGEAWDYYRDAWRREDLGSITKIKFNLAAFFFTVLWLAYRKMYGYACLWLGIWIALACAQLWFPFIGGGSIGLLSFGFCVGLGTSGSSTYRTHVNKRVAAIRRYDKNNVERNIIAAGRTSWLGGIAFAFITVIASVFIGVVEEEIHRQSGQLSDQEFRELQDGLRRDAESLWDQH